LTFKRTKRAVNAAMILGKGILSFGSFFLSGSARSGS